MINHRDDKDILLTMSKCGVYCRYFFPFLLVGIFSLSKLFAQVSAPKYSNEFMSIGIGARALGMGNAVTATVSGSEAGFWNPSLLNNQEEKYDLTLMHTSYFSGIANFDYVGFSFKIDSTTTAGFTFIRLGVDDIPDTRFLYDASGAINYDNITFFSAADYGFLFSFVRRANLLGGINLGGNLKVIHRSAGDFAKAWGIGVDFAANKQFGEWKFGAVLRDATGTFNAWNHNEKLISDVYNQTGNTIPDQTLEITVPALTLGVSRTLFSKNNYSLDFATDLKFTFDGKRNVLLKTNVFSIDPYVGIELGFKDYLFFRSGINRFQEIKQPDNTLDRVVSPSVGLGINISRFRLDYALTDFGVVSVSPYSHIFTLGWSFESLKGGSDEN